MCVCFIVNNVNLIHLINRNCMISFQHSTLNLHSVKCMMMFVPHFFVCRTIMCRRGSRRGRIRTFLPPPPQSGQKKTKKNVRFSLKTCKICQKCFALLLSATNLRCAPPLNLNPGSAPDVTITMMTYLFV